ncbi:hypothetical protein HY971_05090 [Candidatus Kaiserbacteria bacterium]|nr:hypothetical protein [Candidatus Kaiserbacteria bacterium]
MDARTDSPKEEGIAKFVDKQAVKTNPFGENRVGERAYRRSERLASAIFLLTAHVSDTEPIKRSIRKASLDLLAEVLELRDEMRASNSGKARDFKSTVRKLISMTRLLAISGYVSFQNADSVTEALDDLSLFLASSQRSTLSETVSISKEDLLDMREIPGRNRILDKNMSDMSIKDVMPMTDMKETKAAVTARDVQNVSMSLSTRSGAIVEVLKVSGELGIRDIASNLPEYSEKMIQRELGRLVLLGKVKKTGLKRWSRYSLA